MATPLISVIIPTYNRAAYVVEAVNSVLGQTYSPLELFVIDDGSTDATPEVLRPFAEQLSYIRTEHGGIAAARNLGVASSNGEYIAFLDDDDIWVSNKLQLQMAAFQESPDLDAVYCHAVQFISPELDAVSASRLQHMAGKILPAPVSPALLIRRKDFERIGAFNESLNVGVDMDWYARLVESGMKSAILEQVLYRRRLHRSNTNVVYAHEQSERLKVLKMALDRRRAAQTT